MWVNIANGIIAVIVFAVGYYCGYVKDKKEVGDFFREAKCYYEEAEKKLNEAQKLLDKAHDYYEETHAELERLKEEWGEAATEGESEALR